ncbi:Endonuclease/Exonuclease/phosphatase [Gracilaria domingensis]|nr:Endonuclease/Exonuclease/phosphatase [Gracilaria domingensis]
MAALEKGLQPLVVLHSRPQAKRRDKDALGRRRAATFVKRVAPLKQPTQKPADDLTPGPSSKPHNIVLYLPSRLPFLSDSRIFDQLADAMNPDALNSALSKKRKALYADCISERRHEFTTDKELNIFAGTWNVNGRSPEQDLDLTPWLFPLPRADRRPFDVYMLGLQEVQSLTGMDAVRSDTIRGVEWRTKIHQLLDDDYDIVAEKQLVGIMILVFVRKNHFGYLANVKISTAATGFLNAVGNKGGIAVRFQLYDRTISCVSCHLTAHTGNVERRNQDFRDVVRKAVFEQPDLLDDSPSEPIKTLTGPAVQESKAGWSWNSADLRNARSAPIAYNATPGTTSGAGVWFENMKYVRDIAASALAEFGNGSTTTPTQVSRSTGILAHDVVFWLGDLNYRIDAPLERVMGWIRDRNWIALRNADELQYQMRLNDIFKGFREGPLQFPPTYKFDRYSDKYATDENGDLKRTPAYTDRILWKPGTDEKGREIQVRLGCYDCAKVYSSDHRPVHAHFGMTFGVEDASRKKKIEGEVQRRVEYMMDEHMPKVLIDPCPVAMGKVFFRETKYATVLLRNKSERGAAHVRIEVAKDQPEWLRFDATQWQNVVIHPGESAELELRARVGCENGLAARVCNDGCRLSAELTMLIEPGRERRQIEVCGRYVPTTLGLSLEMLSMMSKSVRSLRHLPNFDANFLADHQSVDSDLENRSHPDALPLAVPKEIWLLIDALLRVHEGDTEYYMHRFPDLFLRKRNDVQICEVLKYVDNGESIPDEMDGHDVAGCLLEVLRNLEDTVIPQSVYRRVIEVGRTEDPLAVYGTVSLLPPLNANVFWYVIGLLCQHRAVEKEKDENIQLAKVFGNVLLPRPAHNVPNDSKARTSFILAAIKFKQRTSPSRYKAVIDLKRPLSHPRKLSVRQSV